MHLNVACFVTAVAPIVTFALSSTDKAKALLDPNEDTISRICFLIAYVILASACLLRAECFLLCVILQELSSHGVCLLSYLLFMGLNEGTMLVY